MAVLSFLFWQMFEIWITIFHFIHIIYDLFRAEIIIMKFYYPDLNVLVIFRMWMTGIIDIHITHSEYIFAFHEIQSRRMRSHWSNSMTAQTYIYAKCTTFCCKGKFIVPYKRSNHEGFYYLKGNRNTKKGKLVDCQLQNVIYMSNWRVY